MQLTPLQNYNCDDEEAAYNSLYYGTSQESKENVKLDFTGSKTEYRDVYGFLKEAGIELGDKMKNTLLKDLNMKPEHIGCYFDQGKKKATCVRKLKDSRQ
ncbi:hypothetical protein ANCCAN_16505 [Ancylostoma caninum]|uniref:Uncharacterized protein n=1 Tax=Ancylostoma caninum TaxID=29170 RepID=A0A368FZF7_ANCCA|nr:hypothetical protein ANCCAN_16505 [Ancylostoma caninum]